METSIYEVTKASCIDFSNKKFLAKYTGENRILAKFMTKIFAISKYAYLLDYKLHIEKHIWYNLDLVNLHAKRTFFSYI